MNNFNIRIGSYFEHIGYYGEQRPFRLLVNTAPYIERQMYWAYGQTWNTHSTTNYYNYWSPNTGDKYYTMGPYSYPAPIGAPFTNLLLIIGGNNCKLLATPYNEYDTWDEVWSNNGSGYLGDPAWDVYLPACKYITGNFNNPGHYTDAGKQIFVWDNDGFAALLNFNYSVNTNEAIWERLWWNNYNSRIGPWFQPGEFSDRIEVGDFDGDTYDEMIIYNTSYTAGYQTFKRAMLLKFINNNWTAIWDNNKSGWIGGWQMPLGDNGYHMYTGDFNYQYYTSNKQEVLFINKNTQLVTLQQYTGIGNGWDRVYHQNNFNGVQNFNVLNSDRYMAGNYDRDGRPEEIFFINYNSGDAKILKYQSSLAGCPWFWVYQSDTTGFQPDNNILHRSEFIENTGIDITDRYKLTINPQAIENKFYIQVAETENDYNYFDQFKLYAIDHPVGTKIGITEYNDIVMYEITSVNSPSQANFNGFSDITNYIQYTYNGEKIVTGILNDSIFAQFNEEEQINALKRLRKKYLNLKTDITIDSFALIGEMGSNSDRIWAKCPVADLVINTETDTYYRQITRRENYSEVIIPFAGANTDGVNSVDINWNGDFALTYFSVVPIMYSGFTVNELTLSEANHSINGNIISLLTYTDNFYSELDSSGIITLKFNDISPAGTGYLRDYIFETRGRYITPVGDGDKYGKNVVDLTIPKEFALYQNFPNPFNPVTLIKYDLPKDVNVTVKIYDLLGREVDVLVNNELKKAGRYELNWNAGNYASGVYFYRIEAGSYVNSKKMVLVK